MSRRPVPGSPPTAQTMTTRMAADGAGSAAPTPPPVGGAEVAGRARPAAGGAPIRGPAHWLAAASALAASGTYLLGRLDFARRHHIGIDTSKYWTPAALRIWGPGLGLTVLLAVAAFVAGRRRR